MTETTLAAEIARFFSDFEQASADEDWARYGELFIGRFLNLDPTSTSAVSREDLIAFLPHRKHLFERAGATGTRLATLEVDALDDRHAVARTTWDVVFDREHDAVSLRTTFLLRLEDRWRIALYLNHANLLELLGLT